MSVINNLILLEAFIYDDRDLLWRHGVVVITAAQLHLIKLNSGSAQAQALLAACRRFAMVRVSDDGPG